ncbi:Cysteine protease atg4 [Dispira simplex]|nr:Cysteine protease atg4 [Dispira simplex]
MEQWGINTARPGPGSELWLLGKRYVRGDPAFKPSFNESPDAPGYSLPCASVPPSTGDATHFTCLSPQVDIRESPTHNMSNPSLATTHNNISPSPVGPGGAIHKPSSPPRGMASSWTLLPPTPSYPLAFLDDFQSRIWCTYRANFATLPDSDNLTSDSGWGCMLRAVQSLVAQSFVLQLLGRDWSLEKQTAETLHCYREIINLFVDTPTERTPLSIHHLVRKGKELNVAVGEWFGPHMACHIFKNVINAIQPFGVQAFVATDGVIYEDMLLRECGSTPSASNTSGQSPTSSSTLSPTMILVPTRLGIDQVNPIYYPALRHYFYWPQFLGIAGGRPSSAMYFVGYEDNDLIYLDPHCTRPLATINQTDDLPTLPSCRTYHCRTPYKIALERLDPCMLLGFFVRNTSELEDLKYRMAELNGQTSGAPIVSIADQAPRYLFEDDLESPDHDDMIFDSEPGSPMVAVSADTEDEELMESVPSLRSNSPSYARSPSLVSKPPSVRSLNIQDEPDEAEDYPTDCVESQSSSSASELDYPVHGIALPPNCVDQIPSVSIISRTTTAPSVPSVAQEISALQVSTSSGSSGKPASSDNEYHVVNKKLTVPMRPSES